MSEQDWVLYLLIVIAFSVFAAWFARYSVTMPMFLVLVGALAGRLAERSRRPIWR